MSKSLVIRDWLAQNGQAADPNTIMSSSKMIGAGKIQMSEAMEALGMHEADLASTKKADKTPSSAELEARKTSSKGATR